MSKIWNYSEDGKRIVIEPPKQKKGISGHRLSAVLGLNKYSSPFQAWCEATKLAQPKVEDNKYLNAGRVLEPKIIKYVSTMFPNVMSIEEYYGDVFDEYRYNNFKDESKVFSGVIDAVSVKNDKKTIAMILECKTSGHPEAWNNGVIPLEYGIQGALYAYLKGLDRVVFACTFLQEIDYGRPEDVVVSDKNTIVRVVKLEDLVYNINGEYMNIEGIMKYAEQWYHDYVETGISPEFDEKKDKEYLDIIRATNETKDNELIDVCEKALNLAVKIDELKETSGIKDLEKQLKLLETSIKNKMIDEDISKCGGYSLSRKKTKTFNNDLFAEEQPKLYESYCEEKESYTLTKDKKEGK